MKPEDARRKKAPKGYNYEPVLPGAHAEPQAPTDGKRVRRATSKVQHLPPIPTAQFAEGGVSLRRSGIQCIQCVYDGCHSTDASLWLRPWWALQGGLNLNPVLLRERGGPAGLSQPQSTARSMISSD